MEIKKVTGNIIKSVVAKAITDEFSEDREEGKIGKITKEQLPQFSDRPIINIRQRRVSQDNGHTRSDIMRLYMFDIQYLHPNLEDSTAINYNEIADDISSRVMFALREIKVPFYYLDEDYQMAQGIDIVRANSIEDVKDTNVLTVLASYYIRMSAYEDLAQELIEKIDTEVYLKEVKEWQENL